MSSVPGIETDAGVEDLLAVGPRVVEVMLTTQCNLRCGYCYQDRSRPRTMPGPVLDASLERILRSGYTRPRVTLFGGEPLLDPGLVRRAVGILAGRHPSWMRPDVSISTNGLLLDERMLRDLVEADVSISLSFDGVPGAQDLRARRSFATLDLLLVRLRRDYPDHFSRRFRIAATLTSGNVSHLADSVRYFLHRGVRAVDVVPLVTRDSGWDSDSRDELDRQLADVVEQSRAVYEASGVVPFRALRGSGGTPSCPPVGSRLCGAGGRKCLFVDVDGKIAPCAAMADSARRDLPPVLRGIVRTLRGCRVTDPDLDGKLSARERAAEKVPLLARRPEMRGRAGACVDCPAAGACVICPASVAFSSDDGRIDRVPDNQCDFNRLVALHRESFRRLPGGVAPAF